LKHATTTTKSKVANVRAKLKNISTADVNKHICYDTEPLQSSQFRLSNKLSLLFEPCHARRFCGDIHYTKTLLKIHFFIK